MRPAVVPNFLDSEVNSVVASASDDAEQSISLPRSNDAAASGPYISATVPHGNRCSSTAEELKRATALGSSQRPSLEGETPTSGSFQVPCFEEIYEGYFPYVWRTLLRMGVPAHHAEDATQDVFIVVHRQLGGFEGRAAVKTWLFSIAFRVAREWLRRGKRSRSQQLPQEVPDEHGPGPFEGVVRNQAVALLYKVLGTLHPDKRAVFILGELEQMSVPEIAEVLDANVNTVASRLRAARKEFDATVQRHDARTRRRPR